MNPTTLAAWRDLDSDGYVAAVKAARWFVQPDDEIGGWCVMPVDGPPSTGYPRVADFVSREIAEDIVELHNAALTTTAEPVTAKVNGRMSR